MTGRGADIGGIFGGAAATTFMGLPEARLDALKADVVILGAPSATPYGVTGTYSAAAPQAIRKAVAKHANARSHIDFDQGGPVGGEGRKVIADAGDLAWDEADFAANRQRIREAVTAILKAGAVPVVLGGDDSIPIPVLQAYEHYGPLTILQIDAHIDWRDEIGGERLGLSSNMRRASEMAWIERIVQVGQRGIGSARPSDAADARAWGVHLISGREVHQRGIGAALEAVPAGARVFINFDVDALDPAIMPAVIGPAPGGLSYWDVVGLIDGVAQKARIAGFSIVELAPERDVNGLSALTAARIVANVLGRCARA
jgi:agmatinase